MYRDGWKYGVKFMNVHVRAGTEPATSTGGRRPADEERALRSSCQNSMVLGAMFLSDPDNYRKLQCTSLVSAVWEEWFSVQSETLRTAEASKIWLLDQLTGGFMSVVSKSLAQLSSAAALRKAGFQYCRGLAALAADPVVLAHEDSFASFLVRHTLVLQALRLRRHAWMLLGPSARSVLCLQGHTARGAYMDSLRRDWTIYQDCVANPDGHTGLAELASRSPFALTTNVQIYKIFEEAAWSWTSSVESYISRMHCRIISTHLCEDGVNRQKNTNVAPTRTQRVERSFGSLVKSGVMSYAHHFKEVDLVEEPPARDTVLNEKQFRAVHAEAPEKLKGIVGHSEKTQWYSPSAELHAVPFTDILLLRTATAHAWHMKLEYRWLCALFSIKNNIIVRNSMTNTPWMVPVLAVGDSVCIMFPCEVKDTGPGQAQLIRVISGMALEELCVPVVDLHDWQARPLEWRSPMWMQKNDPERFKATLPEKYLAPLGQSTRSSVWRRPLRSGMWASRSSAKSRLTWAFLSMSRIACSPSSLMWCKVYSTPQTSRLLIL